MRSPSGTHERWLFMPRRRPEARVRLYCLPYAGTGASAYASWAAALPPWIEMCALQLPGREQRLGEPPFEVLDDASAAIADVVDQERHPRFAIFGHSMGGLLAFEVVRRLRAKRSGEPVALFVSGVHPPDEVEKTREHRRFDDRDELLAYLRSAGGMSDELLAEPELIDFLLPIVAADLATLASYRFREGAPLGCPVFVSGGRSDALVPPSALDGWRRHTSSSCDVTLYDGGHFFLREEKTTLLERIAGALAPVVDG